MDNTPHARQGAWRHHPVFPCRFEDVLAVLKALAIKCFRLSNEALFDLTTRQQ